MSAIQFLREKAGVLVAGVIGFSLLLFVISDFFGGSRGQRLKAKKYYELGEIAGQYVSYQDYEQKVQNLMEIYKLSGNSTIDEATSESIRQQVWEQMVRASILEKQYKKLGIGVSTEEVDELVLGDNPHPIVRQLFTDQSTGVFNKSFLVNFLKQIDLDETAKKYWLFFEDQIVNDRQNSKYNTLVSKGLYATSKETEFVNNLNKNTVDFSFIEKNYASVPDSSVTITKSELESYYSAHKEDYKRSALRDIEYVTFDVIPSGEDINEAEKWINTTKLEFETAENPEQFINLTSDSRYSGFYVPLSSIPDNLKDFVKKEDKKSVFGPYQEEGSLKLARLIDFADRPDSVHARHILLAPTQTRNLEKTRVMADSLVKLIKSGAPFATVAMANSVDQGSAQLGGDLGWFQEGRMIVPFNDACFTGKKGEIITVETTYGVHIIELLGVSKSIRKYKLGIIDRKIIPSSVTTQRIYSMASQFAGTNNTYDKFNSAITAQNLNKRVANDVSPEQKTLPGLENPRSLIISLFATKQGQIVLDNNSQAVFDLGDKYIIAFCTKAQEEGTAPLKDVENDIRFTLVKDKKADIISALFKKNFGEGKTLDDIGRTMGLNVQEATQINFRSYTAGSAGTEPTLIAAASSSRQGVIAGPVKGNNGVFLVYVNDVTASANEDLKMLQKQLSQTFEMRGGYEAYEALRKAANIKDLRYKFY